jgi:hypothetical protein
LVEEPSEQGPAAKSGNLFPEPEPEPWGLTPSEPTKEERLFMTPKGFPSEEAPHYENLRKPDRNLRDKPLENAEKAC